MEKRYFIFLLVIFALIVIPGIQAQFYDLNYKIQDFLGFGYYSDAGYSLLKIGLFLLLFALLFNGAKRVFPDSDHKGANFVIAFTISVISIAFIPPEVIISLGDLYGFVGLAVLVLTLLFLPWFVVSATGLSKHLGSFAYVIYTLLFFFEAWALDRIYESTYSSDIFGDFFSGSFFNNVKIMFIVAGIISMIIFFQRRNRAARATTTPTRP